jgi:hypothetical protein
MSDGLLKLWISSLCIFLQSPVTFRSEVQIFSSAH